MKKLILGILVLAVGWLWSRGATNPREWSTRIPQELNALRDDLKDAVAAGRRAGAAEEESFTARFGEPHIAAR